MSGTRHRVRVQHHGQITLPAVLRRKLGLKPGDVVDIEESGSGVMVTPERTTLSDLFPEPTSDELALRRAAMERILARRERSVPLAPLTAADLVRMGREEEGEHYDPGVE